MSLAGDIAAPSGGVQIVPGFADVYPLVRVGGLPQPAAWAAGVYAAPGEPVFVAVLVRPDAPAQYVVLGRAGADGPREGTVTTVPGGSDTITVTADGADYTATFGGFTPSVGDRVRLLWQGRDVTALCKVGVTPGASVASQGTQPPPPATNSGTFSAPATDSSTWWGPGGWDSIRPGGGVIGQGTIYGTSNVITGAWFYGNSMAELAGATVTKIWFRPPARRSVGDYNSPLPVHFHAHTSPARPGGDVSRVAGPNDWTVPAGWAPGPDEGFIELPTDYAAHLINGGGISISGDPYLSFAGKPQDPASGQLRLEWYR